MSNTLEISGDNYISTSNTYVGVNTKSQVVVNGVKTVGFATFRFQLTLTKRAISPEIQLQIRFWIQGLHDCLHG